MKKKIFKCVKLKNTLTLKRAGVSRLSVHRTDKNLAECKYMWCRHSTSHANDVLFLKGHICYPNALTNVSFSFFCLLPLCCPLQVTVSS